MTRHKVLLAISLLSKIGTGMVSLFVLARGLGPADYGFVATVFAYASIAALFTDFGFSVQALRDIGAQPGKAGELIAACVRVKNLLVLIVTLGAVLVLYLLDLDPHLLGASLLLYGSIMVNSYGDLVVVALRGIGKYAAETVSSILGMIVFVLVVGGTALAWPDILPISGALFVARLLQTAIAFVVVSRFTRLGNCIHGPLMDLLRFMRTSSGLALDSFLTTVSAQVDVAIVSAMLGLRAAGLYQVGSRIGGYMLMPSQILAGVSLPKLSGEYRSKLPAAVHTARRLSLEMAAVGLFLGTLLVVASPLIPVLLGDEFALTWTMWAGFGAFVGLRYIAAAFGIILVAQKRVLARLVGQMATLVVLGVSLPISLRWGGVEAAPWAMAVAAATSALVYGLQLLTPHKER
jgi:O-antigen/teichoic acid export membrane protein